MSPPVRTKAYNQLESLLEDRILLLDGAMGTMIFRLGLDEAGVRGERFANHHADKDLKNFADILCLTRPDDITQIHREYLAAGADIVETNTFGASPVAMEEFNLPPGMVRELNFAAVACARKAADEYTERTPHKPRFVAGSIGPTRLQTAISTNVEDASHRGASFDQLEASYYEQAAALVDAGVDILLPETAIDTLNLKACLFAIDRLCVERGIRVPIMASGTFSEGGGTFVSGQVIEAFWDAISHIPLLTVGMNCALGPEIMRPHIEELAKVATARIHCYPNAGMPDEMGKFPLGPEKMAAYIGEFLDSGWLNIVGGCCGTTPEHIAALAERAKRARPHKQVSVPHWLRLSGTHPFALRPESNFVMVGERTNVTGSKAFANLIRNGKFEEAVEVARQQVSGGATIIDINMDDALLDGEAAMTKFLRLIANDPNVAAKVPVMIDSSKWTVIEAGLKCVQGKSIVNSISLKDGEEEFRRRATLVRRYGAATVVMAFDEQGQAVEIDDKVRICKRAFRLVPPSIVNFNTKLPPDVMVVRFGKVGYARIGGRFFRLRRDANRRADIWCNLVHGSLGR